jgi:hypothetical protein
VRKLSENLTKGINARDVKLQTHQTLDKLKILGKFQSWEDFLDFLANHEAELEKIIVKERS